VRQPDTYRAHWATSLGMLAESLVTNGRGQASLEPARRSAEIFAELHVSRPRAYRDRLGWCRRLLAEALLAGGDNERALAEARLARNLLAQEVADRSGLHVEHLAKATLTLSLCERATVGDGVEALLEGVDQIAPWFESRERILRRPVWEILTMLRCLAPGRLDAIPPSMRRESEAADPDPGRSGQIRTVDLQV
jgi:hypothetical protein